MVQTFIKRTDFKEVIRLLPRDQRVHLYNVKKYVNILAQNLVDCKACQEDFAATQTALLCEAAFYHDIGKAWVSTEILSKPKKLTEEEFCQVKKHTLWAFNLFCRLSNDITDMPGNSRGTMLCDAAVFHHEWWNGQGYPFGIRGENIPYIARVIAVCDAYDAMTSDRAYRQGCSHAAACSEIAHMSGVQFDPTIARVFLSCEAEFEAHCRPYRIIRDC